MNAYDLTAMLRHLRLPCSTEAALQIAIWNVLQGLDAEVDREVKLGPADRIDFLVDGVGIEAKTRCDKRAIFRQLERYARHDRISDLILVTGTAIGLPQFILGKPVFFVSLGRAAL